MTPSPQQSGRLQKWTAWLATTCAGSPKIVVVFALVAAVLATVFDTDRFAIDTDSAKLISPSVPWRQRNAAFDKAFPQTTDLIAVVIDGTTPELAERASADLVERLAARKDFFRSVRRPDAGPFFDRNGLLFLSTDEVAKTTERLIAAQPVLGSLAADPSLRGLMDTLQLTLEGVRQGQTPLGPLQPAFSAIAATLDGVLADRPMPLSWQNLLGGGKPDPRALRRFVLVQPQLDYTSVQPGEAATRFIREAVVEAGFDPAHGVRVRLTGEVPMADEEFATIGENALRNSAVMVGALLLMLWFAVRSLRAVTAIMLNLILGLALTAALGLAIYGAFNLISVAFAVLFVGLGVDFGIQYTVAYRSAARHGEGGGVFEPGAAARTLTQARSAALQTGVPLALAAIATAAGFFVFAPTRYRGVAELGVIAGSGMLIAFITSISILPALLRLFGVRSSSSEMGLRGFVPVDRWMASHRRTMLVIAGLAGAASIASLPWLRFDFNPLHLRSPTTESVATLNDLSADPMTSPNTVDVLAPSLAAARALGERLGALPEVAQVLTLESFVPEDQPAKLALITDAASLLDFSLTPIVVKPPPTDAENVTAMQATAQQLTAAATAASTSDPAAADAARVGKSLAALAAGTPAQRAAFEAAVVPGLKTVLAQATESLQATPVSLATLPANLQRDWITADGRARAEVFPKHGATGTAAGPVAENDALRRFVNAVRSVAPDATGAPVSILDAGQTIVGAFVQAGIWAGIAVTVLLILVLRRAADVLRTLASLMLGGLVTLGLCVMLRIPLNDENIIALPLLFGIGVAFNIYFVIAWRRGQRDLLQTSLARAVVFSAMTTAAAFGSLWLSSHPGTSSMGELLVLALTCTLAAALFVLPALLGPPLGADPKRS